MRRCGVLFVMLVVMALSAVADEVAVADERRYVELLQQLRCLVCQNQSVADSNATLAQDMRAIVREMMAQQRSDEEIIGFMKARYGDFVHYRPPFQASTWLLWLSPFVVFIVAAVAAVVVRRRRITPSPLSLSQRQDAAVLLGENETVGRDSSSEGEKNSFR